jgi:hypothetical protein
MACYVDDPADQDQEEFEVLVRTGDHQTVVRVRAANKAEAANQVLKDLEDVPVPHLVSVYDQKVREA